MYIQELSALIIYLLVLLGIGLLSCRKVHTASDFIIGSRSMNYWLTAFAAQASDMSSWLFMAYPAAVFDKGLFAVWIAIGLILGMFLNWHFIAPKIRIATEQFNSLTFSSFFESRLADSSGVIRVFSALILVLFYTVYISANLKALSDVLEILFNFNRIGGMLIGILIVASYVFWGGYLTLAWIDLFQGIFLLIVIVLVPFLLMPELGGWEIVQAKFTSLNRSFSLLPDLQGFSSISNALGWGLGYFGQPHIVTKFMGIKNVGEMSKSKWIGMSWMIVSLGAATMIGTIGVAFFNGTLKNTEFVFIEMVQQSFHPFIVGLILCAVLATTINAISSQILVLSSSLAEDLYKKLVRPHAASSELLLVSRLGVLLSGAIAFTIACLKTNTIYGLVNYAWSGIGASFGPLVVLSLYAKKINKFGAWAGIIGGGIVAACWPLLDRFLETQLDSMLPGFFSGMLLILLVSYLTRHKSDISVKSL